VSIEIEVTGGDLFHAIAQRLRYAEREDIKRQLGKAFRAAGKDLLDDEKRTVSSLPVHGEPFPGRKRRYSGPSVPKALRAHVAAATDMQVRFAGDDPAVRVRVAASKMPTSQRRLPRLLNKPGGWKHPVLGNRHVWVRQVGQNWFEPTARRHFPDFIAKSTAALNDVVDKIAGG